MSKRTKIYKREESVVNFINGVDYSWQVKPEFNKVVTEFHKNKARRPEGPMTEAKKLHTKYTQELETKLKKDRFCSRMEFTGSAYEGVKVNNDIEFDIMVIMNGGRDLQVVPTEKAGYFLLQPTIPNSLPEFIARARNSEGHISANKMAAAFFRKLNECIEEIKRENSKNDAADDELKTIKENITHVRRHGPAVQMDVKYKDIKYSVDMVPTFQVTTSNDESMWFVAKPLKGIHQNNQLQQAWRRSFSLDEKKNFDTMDADNGCRKQVLRILKVLRNREPGLALLTSYHLKTALFHELDDPMKSWKPENLGERVMNMIARLIAYLKEGKMRHYYLDDVDLLEGIKSKAIENMRDRLKHLNNSEKKIRKILES